MDLVGDGGGRGTEAEADEGPALGAVAVADDVGGGSGAGAVAEGDAGAFGAGNAGGFGQGERDPVGGRSQAVEVEADGLTHARPDFEGGDEQVGGAVSVEVVGDGVA